MMKAFGNNRGFTLLEVLIATSLLGIIMAGLPAAFVSYSKYNTQMELRTQALVAAESVVDSLRVKDPGTFPTTGSLTNTVSVNGIAFDVVINYCTQVSYCDANSRHLQVVVNHGAGNEVVRFETIYSTLL